jgi:hypothetical protein
MMSQVIGDDLAKTAKTDTGVDGAGVGGGPASLDFTAIRQRVRVVELRRSLVLGRAGKPVDPLANNDARKPISMFSVVSGPNHNSSALAQTFWSEGRRSTQVGIRLTLPVRYPVL